MRMSQLETRNKEAADAEAKDRKNARINLAKSRGVGADIFKQGTKDSEQFKHMSDSERVKYYTRLCVENRNILESNKALKNIYMTQVLQNEGIAEEQLETLKQENRKLRVELSNLVKAVDGDTKVKKEDVLGSRKTIGGQKKLFKTVKDKGKTSNPNLQYVPSI